MAPDESREPRRIYARRRDRFEARCRAATQRGRRVTAARAAAFAGALALGLAAEGTAGAWRPALWAGAAATAVAFALLVVHHRRLRRREEWAGALAELNREALARLRRAWDGIPAPDAAAEPPPADHPYGSDLDLFGDASVRALLGTVSTAPGAALLRRWLLQAAHSGRAPSPQETAARRRLVRPLAERIDVRETLAAHGRLSDPPGRDAIRRFVAWAEGDSWLSSRPGLRWASWLLPLATWGLAAGHLSGLLGRPWWALPVLLTLYLAGRTSSAVHAAFDRAAAGEAALDRWASSLETLAGLRDDPRLAELAEPLTRPGGDAPRRLRRLDRLVHLAEARHGLAHFFLQALFCWDLHVLGALERWKDRSGSRVQGWIDALARADALSAIAALRHAHPGWARPEITPGAETLEAEALGHPLLAPEDCVRNDVTVGPPGTFLFVTGSNMSGKSTLLRALGLNGVLARLGAPVCARRLRLPPLAVHTSIRVDDSVVRGVSQYMAELERVRAVVDSARTLAPPAPGGERSAAEDARAPGRARSDRGGPPRLLYLLDEPLQGTNEAERREAVRIVLRELLASGAVGAVATHDLRLHETEDLREAARPVHFEAEVRSGEGEGPPLRFDYRLRAGPATSTNALDLLRLAGLGAPDATEGGEPAG